MKRQIALLFVLLLAPLSAQAQGILFFRNARVFDGMTTSLSTDVIVQNGKVLRVGHALAVPAGATVIDAAGKTLLPGFIDSHTHAFGDALREAVVFGVTTELDMFTDAAGARAWRAEQAAGKANDRADLYSAGTLVTAPRGHGTEYGMPIPTITSPDSAQAFVDARIAEGSDYIKIVYDDGRLFGLPWTTISNATLRAVITAAHKRGKMAVVHISTAQAATEAISAGADGVVHLFTDVAPPAGFATLLKTRRAFATPTLVVLKSITGVGGSAPLADDARLQPYLAPQTRSALKQGFNRAPGTPNKDFAFALATVRQLKAAGVPILAGTDAPNPGTAHGASMHRELELLVEAGLTPTEALAAATSVPARTFKLGDRGRIAAGMRADLVLVNGDPTKDITATRAIEGVWKAGNRIDRDAFARNVAAALTAASAPISGLENGLISDFETGSPVTLFGSPWFPSTDTYAGGKSTGAMKVVDGGAHGSAKSFSITGDINPAFAYPWSGAMWSPRPQPMQPGDLSSKKGIHFWTKGDGGTYRVMIFTEGGGMVPVQTSFTTTPEWKEVDIPWSTFSVDGKGVMGIIFTGGPKAGPFAFQIDDVRLQ